MGPFPNLHIFYSSRSSLRHHFRDAFAKCVSLLSLKLRAELSRSIVFMRGFPFAKLSRNQWFAHSFTLFLAGVLAFAKACYFNTPRNNHLWCAHDRAWFKRRPGKDKDHRGREKKLKYFIYIYIISLQLSSYYLAWCLAETCRQLWVDLAEALVVHSHGPWLRAAVSHVSGRLKGSRPGILIHLVSSGPVLVAEAGRHPEKPSSWTCLNCNLQKGNKHTYCIINLGEFIECKLVYRYIVVWM